MMHVNTLVGITLALGIAEGSLFSALSEVVGIPATLLIYLAVGIILGIAGATLEEYIIRRSRGAQ